MPSNRHKPDQMKSAPSVTRSPLRIYLLAAGLMILVAAAAWIRLAPLATERRLESASLAELESLAAREKGNPRVLYHLARRQEQNGQVRAAMDTYWRALQLAPHDEAGWLGWERTTEAVLGPEQAGKVLELWLQAMPQSVTAHTTLAQLHQRRGDHPAAYEAATKGAALEPGNGELQQILGVAAVRMGKPAEAEAAFRRAVAIHPDDWRNHTGLSDALERLSRPAEALDAAREAARRAPQEAIPHLRLGTLLLEAARTKGEIEAARSELLQASARAESLPPPGQFQLALTLGDSYKRLNHWKEALEAYKRAEQLRPYDPTVPYRLMRVYRGLGDAVNLEKVTARYQTLDGYDREIKVLTSRLESAPEDRQARLKLARLYARCEQVAQAVQNYQALLAIAPQMQSARQELEALLSRATSSRP